MNRTVSEKEKLVAEFFPDNGNDSLVLEPQDFIFINENGILDAKILLEIQTRVEHLIENSCFVLKNDESVNACAMQKEGVSIIALNVGTIKKILSDASIMMLSDEFLPEVGEMSACYQNVIAEDYPFIENEQGKLLMTVSKDPYREAIGYMIASLAIHFIVYHEVGHHKKGHVKRIAKQYGLFYCEVFANESNQNYLEERKQMELDADLYAMEMLIDQLDSFIECWRKHFNEEWTYSEMYELVVAALVLVKENLPVDVYLPEEIEKSYYLPNIIRIILAAMIMMLRPEIKKILYRDISLLLKEDSIFRQQFEQQNQLKVFHDDNRLTENAYIHYCSLMIVRTEQIYCNIFIGSNFPTAFRLDVKALKWFKSYK